MSIVMKALAWVSPSAAANRMRVFAAIDAKRSYDGATMGRRGAGFKGARADSANGAIGPALAKLRERSSDLVRNTWIGSRTIDVLSAHTIGTGITVAWRDKRAQDLWDEWCLVADIEGEKDFAGVQNVAFRSMLERGDSGVRMIPRTIGSGRAVPLALQVTEGDIIATERDGVFDKKRSRLGVVLGDWNERLGYWLYRDHPSEPTIWKTPQLVPNFVPRQDFCHLYRPLRAGQVRGVPLLAPVTQGIRDYYDALDAMVVKLRMEACYGMIINSTDPTRNLAEATGGRRDDAGRNIEGMAPGMIYRAGLGETITSFSPSGAGQFEPVGMTALMGIASGGMVTYDQLTGDLRQANYSSMKAGDRIFKRLVEQQQWLSLVPMLMHRVSERFLDIAITAGKLKERKAPYMREYVMPAVVPIDPLKDLKADILAVRAGRISPQEFINEWGRDWRKVLAETKQFWAEADKDGLTLDIDPRRVDQLGTAQPDPTAKDDTASEDQGMADDTKQPADSEAS
jgi:lambda family phage portal protein